jgi:glycosyltransferase involved in cell wall biosynthesis
MKILISSLTYPLRNGVTVSIDATVDGLLAKGDKVLVVAPRYAKAKHRPEHCPVPSSVVVKALGSLIGKEEKTFGITARYHINKIIREFDPDIIWMHTLSFVPNAFELSMLRSKKPKVLTYHTLVEEYGRMYAGEVGATLMRRRSKSVANKMDVVITPSSVIKEKLRKYGVIKPIYPIPTGINIVKKYFTKQELHKKFNIPSGSKILLYVGRICREKNIESLLKVMKKIKKENDNIFLLIIGPGDVEKFSAMAKEMNIGDRVIFTGSLPAEETHKIYGGSDVFTFPSKSETQGLVIGEAMMAETPVVAFESQIQPEIYPKTLAIVVKNISEFSDAVLNILKNHEKREKMTKDAKKFVLDNFSREAMTRKQRELFAKVHKGMDF